MKHDDTSAAAPAPSPRPARTGWLAWLGRLRGDSRGASLLEQVLIMALAVVGMIGFSKFGTDLHAQLEREAQHVRGRGTPGAALSLGALASSYAPAAPSCPLGSCRCFAAGTLVATEDGDRPIESIAVGDLVWASDPESGELGLRPVLQRFVTEAQPVIQLELYSDAVGEERLSVTPGHRFWVEDAGWTPAGALEADALTSLDGALWGTAASQQAQTTTVYNLEVAEFHDYFVGRAHALAHNAELGGAATCAETTRGRSSATPGRSSATPTRGSATPGRSATAAGGGSVTSGRGSTPPPTAASNGAGSYDRQRPRQRRAPPGASGGASAGRGRASSRPDLICGQSGAYKQDLGAGSRARTAPRVPRGSDLERDHIPQSHSLRVRAQQLFDAAVEERVREQMAGRCRDLTATEEERIVRETAAALRKNMTDAVHAMAFAVALPNPLHEIGRSHSNSSLAATDARDLGAAARADMDHYRAIMDAAVRDGLITRKCADLVLAVFDERAELDTQDYEDELQSIVDNYLGEAKLQRKLQKEEKCQ